MHTRAVNHVIKKLRSRTHYLSVCYVLSLFASVCIWFINKNKSRTKITLTTEMLSSAIDAMNSICPSVFVNKFGVHIYSHVKEISLKKIAEFLRFYVVSLS